MRHIPPKGYEEIAFFGRDSQGLGDDRNPHDAACKLEARLEGSYIIEEDDGWALYAPVPQDSDSSTPELPPEYMSALRKWLDMTIEDHIRLWESEIRQGLRDSNGKWIGGERKHEGDRGQTE